MPKFLHQRLQFRSQTNILSIIGPIWQSNIHRPWKTYMFLLDTSG